MCDLYEIRLRHANIPEDCLNAVRWYQDPEVIYFSEGKDVDPYDLEVVHSMYKYLNTIGCLYIIELEENDSWIPIGDITLARDTLPIVIGEAKYRSKGIGKMAMSMIIEEARRLNWDQLKVKHIYDYNVRSHRLYTSLGFKVTGTGIDDKGTIYRSYALDL